MRPATCLVLFCAVTPLLLTLPAMTHVSQAKQLQRAMATPVPGAPLTLDGQKAQEIAVLVEFLHAYNTGQVGTALSLFGPPWIWSDCDYRRGVVLAGQGKASLRHWLQQRKVDHDQLDIGSVAVGTVQEVALGITFKRRTSDTIRALGRPQGIVPQLSAKVIFDGRSGITASPSIKRFANGPYGGSLDLCHIH